MSRVGSKNTKPELTVRKIVHALGYRYRLHRKDLPGSPDLVFPRFKKVIFVHGCYWHRHDCDKATNPKTNAEFWEHKFQQNIQRDKKNLADLSKKGWKTMVIWQCETREADELIERITKFLEGEA